MLNQLQINFCENLLTGMSKSESYQKAGYNCATSTGASAGASGILKIPEVLDYLNRRRQEQRDRTDDTVERAELEIRRIAYADIREVMGWDEDGITFVPSDELTAQQAAAISTVKSRRRIRRDKGEDGGETETIEMEVRMHPKLDALEKLAKIKGMYQADRMNDADIKRDLLKTVFWRFCVAMHWDTRKSIEECQAYANRHPEEVEAWGREVMMAIEAKTSAK